jgi:hypothetical protein
VEKRLPSSATAETRPNSARGLALRSWLGNSGRGFEDEVFEGIGTVGPLFRRSKAAQAPTSRFPTKRVGGVCEAFAIRMNASRQIESTLSEPVTRPGEQRWSGHMADDVAATYGPEPLASLVATSSELVLAGSRGTYRIPRTAVTKVGRGRLYPWFFAGLRIHHNAPGLPGELQFKPMDTHRDEVKSSLRGLGYPTG